MTERLVAAPQMPLNATCRHSDQVRLPFIRLLSPLKDASNEIPRFPWNLNPGIIRILCRIKILRAAFRGGICCSPRLLLSGTVNDSRPRPSTFHRNSLIQTINTAMFLSGFSNTFWWERLFPYDELTSPVQGMRRASVTLPHKFLMCVKNDFSLVSH